MADGFEMINISAGSFDMGCSSTARCPSVEEPVHNVTVNAFKIAKTETTWAQYQPCVRAGVCEKPDDSKWGEGDRPVINVSWDDIQVYIGWLNKKTGRVYRLPSEAEWEYAARAGNYARYS